jgi:hypothetical protein
MFLFFSMLSQTGCTQVALRTVSPTLFPEFAATIFEECDPELAKSAIPANLKLMEGLLRNDPDNKNILTTLTMGYAGYSLLFVEGENPERASELYLRAITFGIRALGEQGQILGDPKRSRETFLASLKKIDAEDIDPLLWMTISWNAWINLNLDNPAALGQLTSSLACLQRVMEIDAAYLYGLPYILKGVSLSARPAMFGGNMKEAKALFEKAMQVSNRRFFLAQFYFARYYAVRAQDKRLFDQLIKEILDGNPKELKQACLINSVIQRQAGQLKETAEELFF